MIRTVSTDNIVDLAATKADSVEMVAALALKAPIASPVLTGIPEAPTAASGTNTTQIATTAFVETAVTVGTALNARIATAMAFAAAHG